MILSLRAPSSVNMSSYRAIWSNFGINFMFFEPEILDPGPKILILVPKISDPGPKILILVPKNIRSWSQNPDPGPKKYHILGPSNCFYWGAAAPQTPCCSWGASSPPDPLAGGLQPPVPPCIPRGSASRALRFFLVPRSWKPLTCGYVAAGVFFSPQKNGPHISGSP